MLIANLILSILTTIFYLYQFNALSIISVAIVVIAWAFVYRKLKYSQQPMMPKRIWLCLIYSISNGFLIWGLLDMIPFVKESIGGYLFVIFCAAILLNFVLYLAMERRLQYAKYMKTIELWRRGETLITTEANMRRFQKFMKKHPEISFFENNEEEYEDER